MAKGENLSLKSPTLCNELYTEEASVWGWSVRSMGREICPADSPNFMCPQREAMFMMMIQIQICHSKECWLTAPKTRCDHDRGEDTLKDNKKTQCINYDHCKTSQRKGKGSRLSFFARWHALPSSPVEAL